MASDLMIGFLHFSHSRALLRGFTFELAVRYVNRLIAEFQSGQLPVTGTTTLRTFLARLLHCDPMRISKKFARQHRIGKQVYYQRVHKGMHTRTPKEARAVFDELAEVRFVLFLKNHQHGHVCSVVEVFRRW